MQKIEKTFDINGVLLKVFSSLESIREERDIELIYEMDAGIPKDLKGDVAVFTRLLIKVLSFVFKNTSKREIVLSLKAPEDFLYEEFISLKMKDTGIPKERIMEYLETDINKELEILEGKILYDKELDIYLNISFQINELGYRRHYRLPNISMLGKKVLLLSPSVKGTQSIEKMFKYFLYEVDSSFAVFKAQGNNLSCYDIVVLDDSYVTEVFEEIVAKIQKEIPFKYVLLRDSYIETRQSRIPSAYLIKPVTQESVFDLISILFENDIIDMDRSKMETHMVDLEKILHL